MKHYIKALERILLLEDRVKAIEKKQAERFPMLVEKLNKLEKDAHTHTLYGGPAVPITKEDAEGGSW